MSAKVILGRFKLPFWLPFGATWATFWAQYGPTSLPMSASTKNNNNKHDFNKVMKSAKNENIRKVSSSVFTRFYFSWNKNMFCGKVLAAIIELSPWDPDLGFVQ